MCACVFFLFCQIVAIEWVAPLPLVVYPATFQRPSIVQPAFSVRMLDAANNTMVADVPGGACAVAVDSGATASILTGSRVLLQDGIAVFDGVMLTAGLGSHVPLTISCQRAVGVQVATLHAVAKVADIAVAILDSPQHVHVQTLISLSIRVTNVADGTPFDDPNAPQVTCTLSSTDTSRFTVTGQLQDAVSSGGATFEAKVHVESAAQLGSAVVLRLACILGEHAVTQDTPPVTVQRLSMRVESQAAFTAVPSSSDITMPVRPAVALQVLNHTGQPLTLGELGGSITCSLRVSSGPTGAGVGGNEAAVSATGLALFSDLTISAPFGSVVHLEARCVLWNGLELPTKALQATLQPSTPLVLARSDGSGSVKAAETDPNKVAVTRTASHDGETPVAVVEVGLFDSSGALQSSDGATTCTARSTSAEASVRQATGRASGGVVRLVDMVITGKVGHSYTLVVQCSLGDHELPATPRFNVTMAQCGAGTQPGLGQTGCEPCPEGTYSDGGVTKCITCPAEGVVCEGGRMSLKPGFYVSAADLAAGITGATVVHTCWNAAACVVDPENRSVACAEGYAGPLCGVCDEAGGYAPFGRSCSRCWPAALNWVLVAATIMLMLAGITYLALAYSFKQSSRTKIIIRILLVTHTHNPSDALPYGQLLTLLSLSPTELHYDAGITGAL